MPSKLSLPQLSLAKDKIRVLLLEGVNDSAVQLIEAAGYSNTTRLSRALEGDALDAVFVVAPLILPEDGSVIGTFVITNAGLRWV